MQTTQALSQTIHHYCMQVVQLNDFSKNQQVLEQLKTFLMDWNNLPILKQIVEIDSKPETVFILYQLLQKNIAAGASFINVIPTQQNTITIEDFENREKQMYSYIVNTYIDMTLNYLLKSLDHPNFTINTVIYTLAYMLRKYWSEIVFGEQLLERLINQFFNSPNPSIVILGCKFFENLLSCVRQYFYASGYLEFRKVMISFQRQSLQLILIATHKLTLQQLQNNTFLQIYQQNKIMADSIITLLNTLLTFNFNLSFYEIDMDTDSKDNVAINFPEFYYSMIQDMKLTQEQFRAFIEIYQYDQAISMKLIGSLQRMASIRLAIFFGKHWKKGVRRNLWEGLLYILQGYKVFITNNEICSEVCSFIIRLVTNFTLRKLNKFSDLFDQCINQLTQMNQYIINNGGVKISPNSVFIKLQEVWSQIMFHLNTIKPSFLIQTQTVFAAVKFNFKLLLQAFINGDPFSEVPPTFPVKKIKKHLEKSFQLCVTVYQENIVEYTLLLLDYISQLPIQSISNLQVQEQTLILKKLTAIICLVSTLVLYGQQNDLTQGFNYYAIKDDKPASVSKLISTIIEIISFTNSMHFSTDDQTLKLHHSSILIFMQTYLQQTIDNLMFSQNTMILQSQSQFFQCLIKDQQCPQNYLIIIEKFLERCFQIFTLGNGELIDHSFIILQTTYQKLKRQLDRRYFKTCSINNMLKQFFAQIDLTCFNQVQYIKKRKSVYQIIALVWVDDQQDDYITSLVEIYNQIKSSIAIETTKINMLKYIWDLIGVTNQIEVDAIFRVFLRIIYPDLSTLLSNENTILFVSDFDSSIAILSLILSIFKNKTISHATENIQIILYQIFGKAQNYFMASIDFLLNQAISFKQAGRQLPNPILKMCAKLFKVMADVFASKQINQGFFLIYGDTTYLDLFQKQLQLIQIYRTYFENLSKYKKCLFECLETICVENSETLAYRCTNDTYFQILNICSETLIDSLIYKQPKGEDKVNDEIQQLNQVGNLLVNIFAFLIQEATVGTSIDTNTIKQKILALEQNGKQVLSTIFKNAFSIFLANQQSPKYLNATREITYAISLCNPIQYQQLLVQLIQEFRGSFTVPQQILEPLERAYQVFESCLNPATRENFTKNIGTVFENLVDKHD